MSKGDPGVPPVLIGGTIWNISVQSGKSVKELRGLEGLCQYTKHRMLINSDVVPPERYESVRFHEEFHASADMHEARYAMQRILKVTADEMFEIEEHFIRLYGSAMFAQLKANGHLTYPEFQTVDMDEEDSDNP